MTHTHDACKFWWSPLYHTTVKGHLSKNSASNAMNWQCGMCKIAT